MSLLIPVFRLPTLFTLCFALTLIVPEQSIAQEETLPLFSSFSYLKDPLFNPVIVAAKSEDNDKAPTVATAAAKAALECPSADTAAGLSSVDEFETRLAIDKALSQILKLTVDYGALRNRVSSLCEQDNEKDQNWFTFGQKDTQGEKDLEALQQSSQKQIAAQDKQLAILQTRLEATQKRYDSENVARLLAEKRLKATQDGVRRNDANVTKTNREVLKLAEQLEKNKTVIRQLKIDLTDEKLKVHQLSGKQTSSPQKAIAKQLTGDAEEAMPSLSSISDLSVIRPASEWTIQGLEFEQGSAEIKRESAENLDKLINHMRQNKKLYIQINGYTDSIGSASSNLKLSKNRAQAVADYLQKHGVDLYRIKVLAYGEQRPVASNETEAGRVKNRRVAVLFLN